MSTQTTGRAALVEVNLPSAKTISTTTGNATSPIVVTTSAPHGLQTNEIVAVAGVGGNTAANGTWIASVASSTQVMLLAYPGGGNSTGNGAYTSGGLLQSYGFGVTVPVPNDLTDMTRAGSVNVPHEAALDRLAWLMYQAWLTQNQFVTVKSEVPVITDGQTLSDGTWSETPANDGAFHDAGSVLVDFATCSVGDKITVWLTGQLTTGGSTSGLRMGFRDDFSGTNILAETTISTITTAQTSNPLAFSCTHTVTVAGTCRVVLRLMRSGGTALTFLGDPGSLVAQRVHVGV